MKLKPIEEIESLCQKVAQTLGLEVIDVEFKMSKEPSLTIFIDKEDGLIDLEDCERMHRAIDEPLDELNPTNDGSYTLNVSSPGLDRPFKKERDFLKNINEKVELKLYAPFRAKKYYEGVLKEYDGNSVVIGFPNGDEDIKFNMTQIAKISKLISF